MKTKIYIIEIINIILIFLVLNMFFTNQIFGQATVLNVPEWKDFYRREQLLSKLDSNISFLIMPVYLDSNLNNKLKVSLLPFIFNTFACE